MRACSCSTFLPPYPDESGLCAPIGEARPMRGQGRADRRDAPRFRRIPRRWVRLCRSSGSFRQNDPTTFYSGKDGTRRGDRGGGAVDRTYKINKIYRILTDRGYRSARAFALRMGRLKIPNPTSELSQVRFFYPPILTSQDFARRSGNRDTKSLRNEWPRGRP